MKPMKCLHTLGKKAPSQKWHIRKSVMFSIFQTAFILNRRARILMIFPPHRIAHGKLGLSLFVSLLSLLLLHWLLLDLFYFSYSYFFCSIFIFDQRLFFSRKNTIILEYNFEYLLRFDGKFLSQTKILIDIDQIWIIPWSPSMSKFGRYSSNFG